MSWTAFICAPSDQALAAEAARAIGHSNSFVLSLSEPRVDLGGSVRPVAIWTAALAGEARALPLISAPAWAHILIWRFDGDLAGLNPRRTIVDGGLNAAAEVRQTLLAAQAAKAHAPASPPAFPWVLACVAASGALAVCGWAASALQDIKVSEAAATNRDAAPIGDLKPTLRDGGP
jgi:hypothetical protein